jgi:hypothetical protein
VAPFEAALAARRDETLAAMLEAVGTAAEDGETTWAAPLLDAFAADVVAATELFLPQLSIVVEEQDIAATEGQAMLSVLRRYVLPCVAVGTSVAARQARAEGLLGQGRVLVQAIALLRRERRLQRFQASLTSTREVGEALITSFDVADLLDVLIKALSRWGIASCYLALYEDPERPAGQARLLLAYTQAEGRIDLGPEGRLFPARELVPPDLMPQHRGYALLVEPLYFQMENLGFLVFECGPEQGESYASLSRQVSSALMGSLLVRQQEQAQREAQAAQRQAQAALEELTTTRQITDRVRRAPDTEAILRVTLAELGRVLGASVGVARLGTQDELLDISEAEDG